MDHALDLLLLKNPVHGRPVPDVRLIEAGPGMDRLPEAGLEVVRHHYVPARVDELIHGVRADVSGSAQYQNRHR